MEVLWEKSVIEWVGSLRPEKKAIACRRVSDLIAGEFAQVEASGKPFRSEQ